MLMGMAVKAQDGLFTNSLTYFVFFRELLNTPLFCLHVVISTVVVAHCLLYTSDAADD